MRGLSTSRLVAGLVASGAIAAMAPGPAAAATSPTASVALGDPLELVVEQLPMDLKNLAEPVTGPIGVGGGDTSQMPPPATATPVVRDARPPARRPVRTPTPVFDRAVRQTEPRPATPRNGAPSADEQRATRAPRARPEPSPPARGAAGRRAPTTIDMLLERRTATASEETAGEEPRRASIRDVVALVPEYVKAALALMSVALIVLLAFVSISRRQLAAALRRAHSDTLTGLPNRAAIEEALERMTAQAARTERSLGVVMLDIDHFKAVNDTYGHARGDEVLAAVGAVARSAVRAGDFVGRYAGEELLVLMPETDEAGALNVAEKLHGAIRAIEIPRRRSGHHGELRRCRRPGLTGRAARSRAGGRRGALPRQVQRPRRHRGRQPHSVPRAHGLTSGVLARGALASR